MIDRRRILEVSCAAADKARSAILSRYEGGFTVTAKRDRSPVTEADREAEIVIKEAIREAFPGHALFGEEFGGNAGPAEGPSWLIDPIDGTRSFLHHIPLFATLIAFLEGGDATVAVVDFPALDMRFTAIAGLGAWENGRPIHVASDFAPESSLICRGDRFQFQNPLELDLYRQVDERSSLFRTYTDAFGHALVARGSAALMLDPDLHSWDIAAPALLVREAGGRVILTPDAASSGKIFAITGTPEAVAWAEALLPLSSSANP